jgi:hypothetical protein
MAGSAVGFEDGGISLHQVLGVRNGDDGHSAMPPTRDTWVTPLAGPKRFSGGGGGRRARGQRP